MPIIDALEAYAYRRLHSLVGPLRHQFHTRPAEAPQLTPQALERARSSWWGAEPRWYPADTPPRQHNRVTPLVDGERYFHALTEAIAGAQHYIYVAGWCLTPEIPLQRGTEHLVESRLLQVLDERSRQIPVRILLWSGAFALLQPTRRSVRALQQQIQQQSRGNLLCRLDRTAHFSHCHHQKAIVIDGQVAFVGGMDLTSFQGDRWDRQGHPLRSGPNWHDIQVMIEGEAAADVEHNFRQRWHGSGAEATLPHSEPQIDPSWQTQVQIVRTIPRGDYQSVPKGIFGIRHAYLETLRHAQHYIYCENQYLWSPEVRDVLSQLVKQPPSPQFRIVIVLPARAYSGKWDNDQHVSDLRRLDKGRNVITFYCPYASGPSAGRHPFRYRPTYVHAKVAIVDDEWFTVGSANLNNRGFMSDSEMNALVHDPALARALRLELWAEHLGLPRDQIEQTPPATLIDQTWTGRAEENARIIKQRDRPLICPLHRYEIGHMPGSWVMEEAEVLTFEH